MYTYHQIVEINKKKSSGLKKNKLPGVGLFTECPEGINISKATYNLFFLKFDH